MRSTTCLSSTASALHRVFIAPVEQSQLQFTRRISPKSPPILKYTSTPKPLALQPQRRYAATSAPSDKRRMPRDDEITARSVCVVDEEGKLSDPIPTKIALNDYDRNTHTMVVVVSGEPGTPPICRIFNKKQMRESEKARRKAVKVPGKVTKTVELNWAIEKNDLGHRLKKMEDFLRKGYKVQVELAGKRKGRKATDEEGAALLKGLRDLVKTVDGARESKAMDGKLLEVAKLFFEGKKEKVNEKEGNPEVEA